MSLKLAKRLRKDKLNDGGEARGVRQFKFREAEGPSEADVLLTDRVRGPLLPGEGEDRQCGGDQAKLQVDCAGVADFPDAEEWEGAAEEDEVRKGLWRPQKVPQGVQDQGNQRN